MLLKIRHWLKRYLIRRLAWLAAAVPGACLLMLIPLKIWPWDLARHFHLYWMAALAGLALICCGFRWWRKAVLNALLLVIFAIPLRPYYITAPDAAPAVPAAADGKTPDQTASPEFRFISFNLLLVERRTAETLQALEAADPDMLLLMEFTADWRDALKPLLAKYPWKLGLPQSDSFGIWFGSKLPLEESRLVVVGDGPFPTVVARARVGQHTVGIVGAHPMNPVFPSWSSIWRDQFEAYPAYVAETGGDARLFAGDLNSTPFAGTFRSFLKTTGLHDSACGRGLMNTWSGPGLPFWLGLPIDHILVSDRLKVLDLKTGPKLGSDHRWLEARLRVE
ncbi:MAG: endonuclease/exonuclease/phosphatase family protein [Verrucomicrobiota bacterium]